MTNPYAPPQAAVLDIADPLAVTTLAEPATRLGAVMLDGLIFAGLVYFPIVLTALLSTGGGEDGVAVRIAIGVVVTLIGLVSWCWLTIRYLRRNSQSIGKKICGIKVVRSNGSRISIGRLFWLRNVVNGLISVVPLYGLVDALFVFSASRQCLHDKIADTIVINA